MITAVKLARIDRRNAIAGSQPALYIKMIILFAPEETGKRLALDTPDIVGEIPAFEQNRSIGP